MNSGNFKKQRCGLFNELIINALVLNALVLLTNAMHLTEFPPTQE